MAQKPSIPKGTRDFNALEVAKRSYIIQTVKTQFEHFGFQPIETPSFENSETLMGKYGDEGDRLIFKILNSGDYFKDLKKRTSFNNVLIYRFIYLLDEIILKKPEELELKKMGNKYFEIVSDDQKEVILDYFETNSEFILSTLESQVVYGKEEEAFRSIIFQNFLNFLLDKLILNSNKSTGLISEKALRYDLTVPFARYVVQYQNDIVFPFKRYQIQPVWRADKPQMKMGRFREFYQCDADVVGSKSLFQEVEFIQLYDAVFTALNLEGVTIKINNRKVLSGIAEVIGAQDKLIDFTVALDKLDKIGEEKVKAEMRSKGISEEGIAQLQPLFSLEGDFGTQVESLKSILEASENGLKGIEELEFINSAITALGLKTAKLELDVTLARGLNYYTGAIFEVSAPEGVNVGSIGGGGRYDDLTSIFGKPDTSGVGISFGLDRIYLVLEALDLFPETIADATKVLFINFGDEEAIACLKAIMQLRQNGVKAELYPDAAKMKKQMTYADRRSIPYVVLVGEQELASQTFTLKHMASREQQTLDFEALLQVLT